MNLTYQECCEILNITPTSDIRAIKKQYKRLIQQSHPDKFSENSPEQLEAQKAIRKYNAAYKMISDYQHIHNSLPPYSEEEKISKPRKKRPSVVHRSQRKRNVNSQRKQRNSLKRLILIVTIISLFFVLKQFIYTSPKHESTLKPINATIANPVIENSKLPIAQNKLLGNEPIKQEYFTIGASLGEVILIQGKPTYIDSDIWYYGQSSVTFSNGLVSDWHRHPDDPLHIKRDEQPAFQFQPKTNLEKESAIKTPYWDR